MARGRLWRSTLALVLAALAAAAILRRPVADRLVESALANRREWRLAAAARRLDAALILAPGDPRARLAAVTCALTRGEFGEARARLAAYPPASFAAPRRRAQAWNAEGVARYHANQPERAIAAHREALAIARRVGDRRLEAEALTGAARARYYSLGDSGRAWRELERALELARGAGDRGLEADALRHQGTIVMWHFAELERAARELYEPALALYRSVDDRHGAAVTLNNLAVTHLWRGDLHRALALAERSAALKRAIGDRAGLADSLWVTATLHKLGGNPRKALHLLEQGLSMARDTGYRLAEIEIESALVDALLLAGDLDAAIARKEAQAARLDLAPFQAKYHANGLGDLLYLRGDYRRARGQYRRTLALDRAAPEPEFGEGLLLSIARTHLREGDLAAAASYFERGWPWVGRHGREVWTLRRAWNQFRAELLQAQGRDAEALAALLEAAEIETRALGGGAGPLQLAEDRRLYDLLLPLLADPAAGADEDTVFHVLEGLRRRALRGFGPGGRDRRRTARAGTTELAARIAALSARYQREPTPERWRDLRRAYGEYEDRVLLDGLEAAAPATPAGEVHDLRSVQRALPADTALVYLEPTPASVLALVVTAGEARRLRLAVDRRSLEAKVRLLTDLVRRGEGDAWRPVAEDLRRRLIDPLEATGLLAGVRRLGLLPSGFLRDLPFAALVRAGAGDPRPLVDDYAPFYPPSASFLVAAAERRSRPAAVHAFGCDRCGAGGPALVHAEAEAEAVARWLGGRSHLGPEATEAAVARAAPDAAILHLAAHAAAPPELPLLAHLALAPAGGDDGRLTVAEILDLDVQADLVTLGACRTGRSDPASGRRDHDADRIGLLEAWLAAGAASVIASLEPVDDRVSRLLLERFYRHLTAGAGKAEALAAAQRELRRGGFDHPFGWSSYLLAGDPG